MSCYTQNPQQVSQNDQNACVSELEIR